MRTLQCGRGELGALQHASARRGGRSVGWSVSSSPRVLPATPRRPQTSVASAPEDSGTGTSPSTSAATSTYDPAATASLLDAVLPTPPPASSTSSSSSSSSSSAAAAAAAATPSGPPDPVDLQALVKELDRLLAAAAAGEDSGGGSGAQAAAGRRAEADAVALAARGAELGLLRGYGRARAVPKRSYTLEELRLNRIEPEQLLSPKDTQLNSVRDAARLAAGAGLVAAAVTQQWDAGQVLAALFGGVAVLTADQVGNGGGGEALLVDTLGRLLRPHSYGARVAAHEAGHLLVAYLVGLLPRAYTLSSLDAFLRYRALNIQAGTRFCDSEFAAEVAAGRLKASSLDRYTCVALAGVVTEYLQYGVAEGGLGDVRQLDAMFRALGFTQKKADAEVRWAVLNTAELLRRHAGLHAELAAAMGRGASVGQCIALIEGRLAGCADV
ncbi:hypothetical protein HYH02_013803 [Chlamydomonas schloesseri]|uniref:Peptidase M41 domain-containing protein n=1 Tax=Chlamydomonas schloesseri TaxID=2026947 RepID=A0A835T2F0_9CHLO|nr:hypothetical protein HYH02_013803 [Chlamydomonas schloesseri]|eukprot:KAG2430326.1 hypothetical protein HYH02_013803 [Chlamydomonas schloesseri]